MAPVGRSTIDVRGDPVQVLVIWPPHVPSYFNAGHHSPLYLTAGYLRAMPEVDSVTVVEGGLLNLNWKAVGDLLFQGDADVIAIMNDFDAVDGLERFIRYARELSPRSKLVTFGRLSSMVPGFFGNLDLDAVVGTGDYEAGVAAFVRAVADGGPRAGLPGTAVRVDGQWQPASEHGRLLPAVDWVLPDITEIPYEAYDRLYAQDAHKFCGIPFRRELVVPVARGCPIGCDYCEVHQIDGLKERRLPVPAAIEYIDDSFAKAPFEYVAFYAPTFTLRKPWVRDLATALMDRPRPVRWKCSTTVHHLDAELVALMGLSGCIRISVGLETLEPAGHGALPRTKQIHEEQFNELAGWCATAGIELNAFVIVGLPGTSPAGVARTRDAVRAAGARFRPTVYTPLHELNPAMTTDVISTYNRQMLPPGVTPADVDPADLYRFVFGVDDRLTTVFDRIPRRVAEAAS
jgi:anaerobic magnesium-protoporphyrin IX monomethyl ester cyclase